MENFSQQFCYDKIVSQNIYPNDTTIINLKKNTYIQIRFFRMIKTNQFTKISSVGSKNCAMIVMFKYVNNFCYNNQY